MARNYSYCGFFQARGLRLTESLGQPFLLGRLYPLAECNWFHYTRGGDHGIPIPVLRAFEGDRITLIQMDQHIDWRDTSQIRELASFFRESELKLHSIHTPIYNDEYWGRSGPQSVLRITEPGKAT